MTGMNTYFSFNKVVSEEEAVIVVQFLTPSKDGVASSFAVTSDVSVGYRMLWLSNSSKMRIEEEIMNGGKNGKRLREILAAV